MAAKLIEINADGEGPNDGPDLTAHEIKLLKESLAKCGPDEYDDLATLILGYRPPLRQPHWDRDPGDDVHNVGALTDEDDQMLCARVCQLVQGSMTAEHWGTLKQDQRIPWMKTAVAKLRSDKEADDYLPPESPSKLAKDMNMSYSTFKKRIEAGEIHHIKTSERRWRIHRDDYTRFGGKPR